jgi:TPR repeat protein
MIHSAIQRRRKAASSLAIALCFMAGAGLLHVEGAAAQGRSADLAVSAPPVLQIAPGGEVPLAIELSGNTLPRRSIVLIRGLPSAVTLSEGRLFESGVWGVAAGDLARVKIASTMGAVGRSDLSISLVSIDGTVLAEAQSTLVIGETATAAAAVITRNSKNDPSDKTVYTAASPQEFAPAAAAPLAPAPIKRLTASQTDQLLALLKKGEEQLAVGNISAARLLYQHAAEGGLAAAALALAATYDEEELKKLRVRGAVQADPKAAQLWYEKAHQLGSAEARSRLQRFGSR